MPCNCMPLLPHSKKHFFLLFVYIYCVWSLFHNRGAPLMILFLNIIIAPWDFKPFFFCQFSQILPVYRIFNSTSFKQVPHWHNPMFEDAQTGEIYTVDLALKNAPKCFKMLQNAPKCSKMLQNTLWASSRAACACKNVTESQVSQLSPYLPGTSLGMEEPFIIIVFK